MNHTRQSIGLAEVFARIAALCETIRPFAAECRRYAPADPSGFAGEVRWQDKVYPVLFSPRCSAMTVDRVLRRHARGGGLFFCTPYIAPSLAALMVKNNCPFADAAGNFFLRAGESVILIRDQKKPPALEARNIRGRAWTPAGLKVLFLLLTEETALNWPYRKIAELSGVSLGSVRYVMADLKNTGVTVAANGRNRWAGKGKTIADWGVAFKNRLLPVLESRFYSGKIPAKPRTPMLVISGETAAEEKSLLKSRRFLAYRQGNINPDIARNHWQENAAGNIEIRSAFWPAGRVLEGSAPWLLIYADLLAEDDLRCSEAALEVYHRYLENRP